MENQSFIRKDVSYFSNKRTQETIIQSISGYNSHRIFTFTLTTLTLYMSRFLLHIHCSVPFVYTYEQLGIVDFCWLGKQHQRAIGKHRRRTHHAGRKKPRSI